MCYQVLVLRSVSHFEVTGDMTFLAFLDVSKAYDTVWREELGNGFRKYLSILAKACMK